MKEQVDLLIDDYQRRIKTINHMIEKTCDVVTLLRLETKASCYRTFIVELERTKLLSEV